MQSAFMYNPGPMIEWMQWHLLKLFMSPFWCVQYWSSGPAFRAVVSDAPHQEFESRLSTKIFKPIQAKTKIKKKDAAKGPFYKSINNTNLSCNHLTSAPM